MQGWPESRKIKMDTLFPSERHPRRGKWVILGSLLGLFGLLMACGLPSINLPSVLSPTQTVGNSSSGQPIVKITPKVPTAKVNLTTMGDPNAPVKMDVWEDFQCPACKQYSENIEPRVLLNYVDTGKVLYTFHFFAFLDQNQGGLESHKAANAALCAADQGRFWEFHDVLFANWIGENAGSFTVPRLLAMGDSIQLKKDTFSQCVTGNTHASQVNQDLAAGQSVGVQGTPSVFVDGTLLTPGYIPTYDQIAAAIDAAISGK
jgi:protein-disulfide isomerase